MAALLLSLLAAAAGAGLSRWGAVRLAGRGPAGEPHACWAVGLAGLVPAWLIVFIALLGPEPARRLPVVAAAAWVVSAAAALAGAIASESRLRRAAGEAGDRPAPAHAWRLGALALLPAWLVALAGHLALALR